MYKNYRPLLYILLLLFSSLSFAFHIMDGPSYTPEAMTVEKTIGNYDVSFEITPTFVETNKVAVITLHISEIDTGYSLEKPVTFSIFNDYVLFLGAQIKLGKQRVSKRVYRQEFLIEEQGNYIIRAQFNELEEPFIIDLPIKVGSGEPLTIIISTILLILIFLACIRKIKQSYIAPSKA